jgi:hypothetical protein
VRKCQTAFGKRYRLERGFSGKRKECLTGWQAKAPAPPSVNSEQSAGRKPGGRPEGLTPRSSLTVAAPMLSEPRPLEAVKKFRPLMNADKRGLKMLVLSALIRVNLRPDSIFSQLLRLGSGVGKRWNSAGRKVRSCLFLGPAVYVVIVLARAVLGHAGHDLRRHVLHIVEDNVGDVTVAYGRRSLLCKLFYPLFMGTTLI